MSRLSLPEPEWDAFVSEADKAPEAFHAELTALQREIMSEQASGKWELQEGETEAQHAARVPPRIRRGITIVALLRKTHTGPAKPKAGAKAPRGRKSKVNVEEISASLLE